MADSTFSFVVIGAGIVGSWTAKELIKHGKVLLLEQFHHPHTRGSSHGQTRIIRSSYEEPFFADMMPHAFKMWREAEKEMDEHLLETTGLVCVADSTENKSMKSVISNMKRVCPEHLMELSVRDLKSKFSTKINFPDDSAVILDKSGGVLYAHKAVGVIQNWYKKCGGIMWDGCKVRLIVPLRDGKIKVCTAKGDVIAHTLVICAGPWTKELLTNISPILPFEPQAVKAYYWKEKELGAYSASSGFPVVLDVANPNIYALPSLEYPGLVKLCLHAGVPCSPDERDKVDTDPDFENLAKSYVKEHFPLLEHEPAVVETCMYTVTPDEVFVIDRVPQYKNIVVGGGFSGTGFKTSPVVGRLLSELARHVEPFLDISPYKFSRFSRL